MVLIFNINQKKDKDYILILLNDRTLYFTPFLAPIFIIVLFHNNRKIPTNIVTLQYFNTSIPLQPNKPNQIIHQNFPLNAFLGGDLAPIHQKCIADDQQALMKDMLKNSAKA